MNFFYAILLGLIQGLTEFLPVSSSGHLVLFSNLFKLESPEESNLFFDVLLHFGTLIAIFAVYKKDIVDMVRDFFEWIKTLASRGRSSDNPPVSPSLRLVLLIVVATLPLFFILPVKGLIEGMRTKPVLVGIALLVTGAVLLISDRYSRGRKTERSSTIIDVVIVGIAQAVAVIPGISRSGMTISTGLFRGFDRKFAVRFSFLLSIPAVLAATLLSTVEAVQAGIDAAMIPLYIIGMAVAAVSGFFAIKLINYISVKGKFGWFSYYCFAAGLVTIITVLAAGQ